METGSTARKAQPVPALFCPLSLPKACTRPPTSGSKRELFQWGLEMLLPVELALSLRAPYCHQNLPDAQSMPAAWMWPGVTAGRHLGHQNYPPHSCTGSLSCWWLTQHWGLSGADSAGVPRPDLLPLCPWSQCREMPQQGNTPV